MPPPNLFTSRSLHAYSLLATNKFSVVIRRLVSDHSEQELSQNCAIIGYYTASGGNFLQTFRDNPSVSSFGFLNSLRNYPEERSSQLLRAGRLK